MRKLSAGLMVVGLLLAMAAPAMAQNGAGDPLGLTLSGAIIPYVGDGAIAPGSLSLLEISSPVGDNSDLHMLFFDATCARQGPSVPNPLTTNDVDLRRVDNIGGVPKDGLIAIGGSPTGLDFPLQPLNWPIHLRMWWANAAGDYIRMLEPIQASDVFSCQGSSCETFGDSWSPLRTGATFFAPPEIPGTIDTNIYLVCPTTSIVSGSTTAATAALDVSTGFPRLAPTCPPGSQGLCVEPTGSAAPIRVLIFDDEETPLRDTTITCGCLTGINVTKISDVYSDLAEAPNGTYTKLFGEEFTPKVSAQCDLTKADCSGGSTDCPVVPDTGGQCHFLETQKPVPAQFVFHAFTGYRAVSVLPPSGLDAFGRLSNANGCDIFPGFVSGDCPDR
jgi:hypothetical protein